MQVYYSTEAVCFFDTLSAASRVYGNCSANTDKPFCLWYVLCETMYKMSFREKETNSSPDRTGAKFHLLTHTFSVTDLSSSGSWWIQCRVSSFPAHENVNRILKQKLNSSIVWAFCDSAFLRFLGNEIIIIQCPSWVLALTVFPLIFKRGDSNCGGNCMSKNTMFNTISMCYLLYYQLQIIYQLYHACCIDSCCQKDVVINVLVIRCECFVLV